MAKRSVGVTDVAAAAGVSLGTVSNVLNRPDRVSPATRERVLRAIEDLGFVRNEAARQLRAGRSRTIGLIVLDTANPFFADIASGVERRAADDGLSLVLCNSDQRPDREEHYLSLLEEQRAFGILLVPARLDTPLVGEIRARGTPVVLVDRASSTSQCSVSVDDVVGGELAVAHLLQLGHRRIGFVGGPLDITQAADRLQGARKAMRVAKIRTDRLTVLETDALNVAGGREAAARLLALPVGQRPTGVFCANDLLALGVLQHMTREGVRVPEDVAIVGYDDIEFAGAAAVPLTSVRQPRSLLGRTATELLMDEVVQGLEHHHRQVVFLPELVVRESSDSRAGHG